MTQKEADDIFKQTGILEDYIINSITAHKFKTAANRKITERQFQLISETIYNCQVIVRECFKSIDSTKTEI